MKGKPAIIISILFGILGFVFVHLYLRSREVELLQIADERTVVIAYPSVGGTTGLDDYFKLFDRNVNALIEVLKGATSFPSWCCSRLSRA